MFDDINILRTNSAGKVLSQVKVPLSYAPARSFIERLEEMSQGESAERRVALKLPRMSFEIVSIAYDAQRQLPKLNHFTVADGSQLADKYYVGVPYTLSFQLSVYARSQDDALQVVEQILPYFAPQYTLSVKPFSDQPEIKEDIPISLTSVDFQDDFEGPVEQRRTIIYNMTFDMRVNFYGPENPTPIVREVNTNINLIDTGGFIENVQVTPNPIDVSPDSDYGFSTVINDNDFTSET
jgi:hypothetical protein